MIRVAIVGAGIMGSSHARVLRAMPEVRVAAVVDPDEERGQRLARYVDARYEPELAALCGQAEAVVVATPTQTHADVAIKLMEWGLDVLIEKPIAAAIAEAEDLIAVAEKRDRILMIGHVERFNPAVTELTRHIDGLIHIDIRRIGPFTPRINGGVVLDLMIHDIELAQFFAGSDLLGCYSLTQQVRTQSEDIASCALVYANGVTATLAASRVSHTKQRQIELTQRDNIIVADLLRQQVTIHRIEHAEYADEEGCRYRQSGVIEIPYLEHQGEPLLLEDRHFIDCVRERTRPRVGGAHGLAALAAAFRIRDTGVHVVSGTCA